KPSETPDLSTPSVPPSENSTEATSSAPPNPCTSNPCGSGSTCEARYNNTHICLCLAGQIYGNGICSPAKVFPGNLDTDIPYDSKMENMKSKEFQEAADKITDSVSNHITPLFSCNGVAVFALVSASVENIYELQSDITEEKITENIKNKVPGATFNDCPLLVPSFIATDLCDSNACDSNTTTCEARSGDFNCTCKKGYVKSTYSTRICTGKCNSWELVLVIVGSVLGGLLLITLIALPLVMRK
uniref:EGF-like domain-containing protein n=1 Tax=Myripristis murdjan TaxID=586833 RepID=A0A668AHP4_9TELE